jgi:hypothetical protein
VARDWYAAFGGNQSSDKLFWWHFKGHNEYWAVLFSSFPSKSVNSQRSFAVTVKAHDQYAPSGPESATECAI